MWGMVRVFMMLARIAAVRVEVGTSTGAGPAVQAGRRVDEVGIVLAVIEADERAQGLLLELTVQKGRKSAVGS